MIQSKELESSILDLEKQKKQQEIRMQKNNDVVLSEKNNTAEKIKELDDVIAKVQLEKSKSKSILDGKLDELNQKQRLLDSKSEELDANIQNLQLEKQTFAQKSAQLDSTLAQIEQEKQSLSAKVRTTRKKHQRG